MKENIEIQGEVLEPTKEQLDLMAEWKAEAERKEFESIKLSRQAGYQQTSDPIFMQYQRGEATEQEWLDAVQAVKDANPYPVQGK